MSVYQRICDAAGPAAALKLVTALGGREIKLSAKPDGKLASIVGPDAAEAIVEAFGREKITIPMAHVRGQRGRRESAARLLEAGASVAAVARQCDVHERTARRVRGRLKDGPGPLFDSPRIGLI